MVFDVGTGFPTTLSTLGCDMGGDDNLFGGEGVVNYIVGGSYNDTIYGSSAMDLVFGDHAIIVLYGDTSHKLKMAQTTNATCGGGSDAMFLGEGDDIVSEE